MVCEQALFQEQGFEKFWTGWMVLCFIGVSISIFALAIAYMIAEFIRSAELKAMAKNELYQAAVSAFIVVGLIGFVNFACGLDVSVIFAGKSGNFYTASYEYLEWIRDETFELYRSLFILAFIIGWVVSYTLWSMGGGIGIMIQPTLGAEIALNGIGMAMSALMIALIVIVTQINVLKFVEGTMLTVFLPIGVMCRCFAPTRGFGGALMGIAIGLFIFYPFILTLNRGLIETQEFKDASETVKGAVNKEPNEFFKRIREFIKESAERIRDNETDLRYALLNIFSPLQWVTLIVDVGALFGLIAKIIIGALFLPVLNFIIVISAVRDLSRLFGDEIDISNLTRMI